MDILICYHTKTQQVVVSIKISCNIEYETWLIDFSCCYTLSVCVIFWMTWYTLVIWKIVDWVIANLPDIDTFCYTVSKICLILSWSISSENFQVLGGRQAYVNEYKFSKILFFAWKPAFSHGQQILLVVFLDLTGSLHFQENVCLIPKSK